jgi:hypothetical protein
MMFQSIRKLGYSATIQRSTHSSTNFKLTKTNTVPVDLFLVANTKKIKLREFNEQKKLGRTSFDYVLVDKVVKPSGDEYERPNGLTLRANGLNLWDFVSVFRGKGDVTLIPENTVIPPELVLVYEGNDHYSLQTSKDCEPKVLNEALTKFFAVNDTIERKTFFKKYSIYKM